MERIAFNMRQLDMRSAYCHFYDHHISDIALAMCLCCCYLENSSSFYSICKDDAKDKLELEQYDDDMD